MKLVSEQTYSSKDGPEFSWSRPSKVVQKKGRVYVVDKNNNRVMVYTENMEYVMQIGGSVDQVKNFNRPSYLAVDLAENVYVLDSGNNCIQIFDKKGMYLHSVPTPPNTRSVAVDESSNIYVSSPAEDGPIALINAEGVISDRFGEVVKSNYAPTQTNSAFLDYDISSQLLVAVFETFPVIQIIASNGRLIHMFEVDAETCKELRNVSAVELSTNCLAQVVYTCDVAVADNLIYILLSNSVTNPRSILCFDFTGKEVFGQVNPEIMTTANENGILKSVAKSTYGQNFYLIIDNKLVIQKLVETNEGS